MGDHSYLFRMNRGNVEDILVVPGPLDARYQFAIRASAGTWRRFAREAPEPMYHGIFAASFRRDVRLEGDVLVPMQSLRRAVRHLELMRRTGAGVRRRPGAGKGAARWLARLGRGGLSPGDPGLVSARG
jgi:hypothetical protein